MELARTTHKDYRRNQGVRFIGLDDKVAVSSKRCQYLSSISILKPLIYIERSNGELDLEHQNLHIPKSSSDAEFYRINISFTLQAHIKDFDNEPFYNRFFDTLSLRYLFDENERKETIPNSDDRAVASIVDSETNTTDGKVGLSVSSNVATPSLEYHIQNEHTLEVNRNIKSWRLGVTEESYHLVRQAPVSFFERLTSSSLPTEMIHFFRIQKSHRHTRHGRHSHCYETRRHRYQFSTHWCWQTEKISKTWSPEVYQSISVPVTITRIVRGDIDRPSRHRDDEAQRLEELERALHFDFEVDLKLRELGHGWSRFKSSATPPEKRLRTDHGVPLSIDRWAFCLTCSPEHVNEKNGWPHEPTGDLKAMVGTYVKEKQKSGYRVSRVPSYNHILDWFKEDRERREYTMRKHFLEQDQYRQPNQANIFVFRDTEPPHGLHSNGPYASHIFEHAQTISESDHSPRSSFHTPRSSFQHSIYDHRHVHFEDSESDQEGAWHREFRRRPRSVSPRRGVNHFNNELYWPRYEEI